MTVIILLVAMSANNAHRHKDDLTCIPCQPHIIHKHPMVSPFGTIIQEKIYLEGIWDDDDFRTTNIPDFKYRKIDFVKNPKP